MVFVEQGGKQSAELTVDTFFDTFSPPLENGGGGKGPTLEERRKKGAQQTDSTRVFTCSPSYYLATVYCTSAASQDYAVFVGILHNF